jgi:two-component system nitrogen regulation sensor histidine kinase NtrY
MSDTSAYSDEDLPDPAGPDAAGSAPTRRKRRDPVSIALIVGLVLAAGITAVAIGLTTTAPGGRSIGAASQTLVVILALNLLLILGLAVAVGLRILRLFGTRGGDAGARLHRRFVGLFAIAAVAPAVVIALFFGVLVTRGVEEWFSQRVRTVVENAAALARSYVDDQATYIHTRVVPMADDLNRYEQAFQQSRIRYSNFLAEQAVFRDFLAVYVIDGEGRVLARAEQSDAPPYRAPAPVTLHTAGREVPVSFDEAGDMGRAVYKLAAYPDAYLYVVRPIGQGVMGQLRSSEAAVVAYRDVDANRVRIQAIFVLAYVSTALLVLVGAVWVGASAATQVAGPVARLVKAADRVAGGDMTARVTTERDIEEIAVLSRAFNRMTSDLQSQQTALRAANVEAESRRRFIEAVLSGVSAGVIGLDPSGRISAINARALALLGLGEEPVAGQPLAELAPELEEVAARAAAHGHDAEAEVDLSRKGEQRRLRVRASRRTDGGLVLTFDDITRLVAAQRNAAWRDVARRIAHEIKNPLTPIQLSAERLRRKYRGEIHSDLETFDRCTDTIVRQVGDIGRMVDEFSAFARMPAPKFAEEDAAELLRQAVFAQRVAYPDVAVELENAGEGPAPLLCDGRLVAQALLNVLKNAGEAVAARCLTDPTLKGRIVARLLRTEDGLAIEVEDNGVGLPAKDRDRLTEPYVTTREKGTGLGLAIVKRILEEHGGELVLTDAHALPGARAILRFPRGGAAINPESQTVSGAAA